MRGLMMTAIALLACVVVLQLRMIDVVTKASDRDRETLVLVSRVEAKSSGTAGYPAMGTEPRSFWDRLTSDS